MKRPIEFAIAVDDFDTARLPEGSRQPGSAAFKTAVARFYEDEFAQAEGSVAVQVAETEIRVKWIPREGDDLQPYAVRLLSAGDYRAGVPLLLSLKEADPNNEIVLFNLGMAESDMGKLDEARAHLERAVAIAPGYAAAWVALGVAQQRSQMPDAALASFEAALEVDPENAYAERNLGAALGRTGNHEEAEKHFRRATILAPEDQVAFFGLAQAVESLGRFDEADELYVRLIRMDPDSRAAEKAKEARGAIASRGFRIQSIGRVRPDAVMFCLAALEEFEQLPSEEIMAVVSEIAALGQGGLAVNDSARKYELKSLPGRQFGGLQLVAMMYVGIQGIKPSTDVGFDLSKEYQQALGLYRAKQG
jgi:tetratricopeptide (TPR) repeat protein